MDAGRYRPMAPLGPQRPSQFDPASASITVVVAACVAEPPCEQRCGHLEVRHPVQPALSKSPILHRNDGIRRYFDRNLPYANARKSRGTASIAGRRLAALRCWRMRKPTRAAFAAKA